MTDDVLELCDLHRAFPGFDLGPLSLRLRPGRAYGLLGPNGAGKTTLLNLIALQLRSTTGSLRRGGRSIRWADSAWKTRVSYIREAPSFYDELTVAQTLDLASRLYDRWDHQLADTLVDTLGLGRRRQVGHLSKGTKVKLGIVSALAHRADLLILDEPTAGLDPTARANLHETIRDLVRRHSSLCVLLSSHIFEDIEAVATEILILRRGRLVFHMSRDTLHDSVLYRTGSPGAMAESPDLVAHWRRRETTWLLVRRGSPLDADLRLRPDHAEEHPTSMVAAVYRGTEDADVD
jgi:ABC-2 type transport system ATP-binding protein